jgi:hypothetical protein
MPSSGITFEQLEGKAGRTLSVASFVAFARTGVRVFSGSVGVLYLARKLDRLTNNLLSTKNLEKLTPENSEEFSRILESLYDILVRIMKEAEKDPKVFDAPIFGPAFSSIRANTEDLEDIIDNIKLSLDPQFRSVVDRAIQDLEVSSK